jgi:hypothetical protein
VGRARALGAAAVVAAVVLGVVAVAAWRRGVRTSDFPTAAGPTPVAGTLYSGPWVVLAVAAAGLAGLLLARVAAGLVAGRRAARRDG